MHACMGGRAGAMRPSQRRERLHDMAAQQACRCMLTSASFLSLAAKAYCSSFTATAICLQEWHVKCAKRGMRPRPSVREGRARRQLLQKHISP